MSALSTQQYLDAASAAITPQRPLLESLRGINEQLLRALHEAACTHTYWESPDLGLVGPLFESLTDESITQAARFPFLLMDLGLSDEDAKSALKARLKAPPSLKDAGDGLQQAYVALARSALVVGWHAIRIDSGAALLLFGFSPSVAEDFAALPVQSVESLAPACVAPLTLRWRQDALLWRQLLTPTAFTSVDTVRGFVMQAVQLTAKAHLA